jgi:hypothetical protein
VSAKRKNFVRLAESRVAKAIDSMRVIGNLANRSNYEYSEEDAKKIISALQEEILILKGKFAQADVQRKDFRLDN